MLFSFRSISIFLAFLCHAGLCAQKTVVANPNLNVLYKGITNTLAIACENSMRKNLVVSSKDFTIIDSNGLYYAKIPRTLAARETWIRIRDKRKPRKTGTDSVLFRLKTVPLPIAQLGTLEGNRSYNKGEIAMQHTVYAYYDGLILTGLRSDVISYRVNACNINNLDIVQAKVKGNKARFISQLVSGSTEGTRIELDSIKTSLENDTFFLKPVTYTIKADSLSGIWAEFHDGKGIKILRQNTEFQKEAKYGDHRFLKQLKDNDTVLLAERFDSGGRVTYFKRYNPDRPGILKMCAQRVSDSLYLIRYYNPDGKLTGEGHSTTCVFDFTDGYSGWNDSFAVYSRYWILAYQNSKYKLMPTGLWKFYHPGGQLWVTGHCRPKPEEEPVGWQCGSVDYFDLVGKWYAYDINGKLTEEKNFDEK